MRKGGEFLNRSSGILVDIHSQLHDITDQYNENDSCLDFSQTIQIYATVQMFGLNFSFFCVSLRV